MVILGAVGAFVTFMVFAWRKQDEDELSADEIARMERERAGSLAV
jgi:cytochrome o ubiquinol oxidase subunit 1